VKATYRLAGYIAHDDIQQRSGLFKPFHTHLLDKGSTAKLALVTGKMRLCRRKHPVQANNNQ